MGLDMYLNRMPRHKGATAEDVSRVENFLYWIQAKLDGSEHAKCGFEEWCGCEKMPSQDDIKFYSNYYKATYSEWDTEKKHPWWRIKEEVGYWRKANHIHKWFVDHIQNGIDDCNYHREVREADLVELLETCNAVLESCKLVEGKVNNGTRWENGKTVPIIEDGKYVKDPSIAEELLPTESGFFFGGTSYDEWYVDDIKQTINIITNVIETTDFNTQMLYYCSSW
jgi:hypothetical protein